jgi:hypothetical protein
VVAATCWILSSVRGAGDLGPARGLAVERLAVERLADRAGDLGPAGGLAVERLAVGESPNRG